MPGLSNAAPRRERTYPFPPYPNSWYAVAWSHDVPAGTSRPAHYFGRNLVVFRGQDGVARVLDAVCPHLGAHLGVDSKVVNNTIECPFHAWRFDGTGQCVAIPYSKNIPGKAQVKSWPVSEVNGHILVYFHVDNAAPEFQVPPMPGFLDPDWTTPSFHTVDVRTHVQEMNENIFDFAHFVYIHHFARLPEHTIDIDGPHVKVQLDGAGLVMGREVDTSTTNYMHGAGCTVIHVTSPTEFMVVVAKTPIDTQTVEHRYAISLKKTNAVVDAALKPIITRQVIADVQTDAAIWENKQHLQRPLLVKPERAIHTFRKWHKQFYSDTASPSVPSA